MKNKTVKELREMAKVLNIKGYYKMRKSDLINSIEEVKSSLMEEENKETLLIDTLYNGMYKVIEQTEYLQTLENIESGIAITFNNETIETRFISINIHDRIENINKCSSFKETTIGIVKEINKKGIVLENAIETTVYSKQESEVESYDDIFIPFRNIMKIKKLNKILTSKYI